MVTDVFDLPIAETVNESSVNRHTSDVTALGRLLMWQRNRGGPSKVPCGTPESTVVEAEVMPSQPLACCM